MNKVEFAFNLKDMASQPLRKFGAAANQTFAHTSQMVYNLYSRNNVLGQSYNELQARIRGVENTIRTSTITTQIRAARKELEALQKQSSKHPGRIGNTSGGGATSGSSASKGSTSILGRFGGMMKGAALNLGSSAINVLGSEIYDSISKSLERQQIQTSLNVLAGSENKGDALTKQLVGLKKDTVLGDEVFQNAQTMMSFGFKSDEIYDNLKMLGDVSMGDAQKLGNLTHAFSNVHATGKLLENDLNQLINAGFNPLEIMSQKTGKSIDTLKDEMSNGQISFEMLQQAFKDATSEGGLFNNMLGKIAETPAGKLQILAGEWDEFKVQAGDAFMPLVSMALDLAQKMMPLIEGLIAPLTTGIQNIVMWIEEAASTTNGWMDYVNIIKDLFMDYLVPLIQKLWSFIVNMVSKLFEFISKSELLKDIFFTVYQLFGTIYNFMSYVVDALEWLFDNIVMPLLEGIEKVYRWIKGSDTNLNANTSILVKNRPSQPEKKEQRTNQQLLGDIAVNNAINTSAAKVNESTISGGGQKVVNIQVAKFLDYINITPTSMKEGEADIERMFFEMFGRVVTQGVS